MGYSNGVYTRTHNFSADASAGINILAARMDAELDDMASAMTNVVWTRDGNTTPSTNVPMGGRRFVNVAAATSVSNYMRVKEFIENVPIFMQDAESSADRISVSSQYFTSVSANQAPVDGTKIMVRVASNKSSAVLYLDGHSANVEYQDGNRIAGAMVSGGIYELTYSSADTAWKLPTPDDGRTPAEIAAGVTPTNYQYEFGNVLRYGATGDGSTNDTNAFANALLAVAGGEIIVPIPSSSYRLGTLSAFNYAGTKIRGASKYECVIKPTAGFTGTIFGNSNSASGTSAYCEISGLFIDLNGENCTAISFASVNNSEAKNIHVKGGANLAGAVGNGVVFDAPLSSGAYSNRAQNCTLHYLTNGVDYGAGANNNTIDGGECSGCTIGVDLAPGTTPPDAPRILNMRFEGCATGLKEGAVRGTYVGLRFENNSTTDVEFTTDSTESTWLGGYTATTVTPVTGLSNVNGIYAISPDLIGVRFESNSSSRGHEFIGPNVLAPLNDSGSTVNPAGAGTVAAYMRGGRLCLDNNEWMVARDQAGTGVVLLWALNTNNHMFSNTPVGVPTYTVGTLPSASGPGRLIYVSDETGGAVIAFNDGTNWRRVTDRAIVS